MVGRGGRAAALVAAAAAAAVTGCAPASQVASTSPVAVHGVVDAPDGTPAAGLRVGLVKQLDAGEALGGLVVIGVSLGLACFGGGPNVPDICAHQPSTATGRDGRFRFQLSGSDTQNSLGRASTFSIVTSLPAGAGELTGPSTSEDLELQAADLEVPALRLWRPPVRLSPAGASLRVDWPPPSSDYGGSPGYDVRLQDAGSLPVWTFTDTHPGAVLDARLLEDSHGGAIVEARTQMPAPGTTAQLTYRSATLAYRGGAGPPPSRGRPCSVVRGGVSVPLSPCTLTDGDLVHPGISTGSAHPPPAVGSASPAPEHAQVDMGTTVPVTLVVVRGCPGCAVEGSTDGTSWSALGTVPTEPGSVEPPGGHATARYVRAGGAAGVGGLREISVWTAAPAPGVQAGGGGPGGPAAGGGAPPAAPSPATDLRPVAFGLVAIAVAIAGLAVAMARRRAPAGRR